MDTPRRCFDVDMILFGRHPVSTRRCFNVATTVLTSSEQAVTTSKRRHVCWVATLLERWNNRRLDLVRAREFMGVLIRIPLTDFVLVCFCESLLLFVVSKYFWLKDKLLILTLPCTYTTFFQRPYNVHNVETTSYER